MQLQIYKFIFERLAYFLIGFLIAMFLFNREPQIYDLKIPVKFEKVYHDTTFIQDTNLIALKNQLIDSLQKEIENLQKQLIPRLKKWEYDDKNLYCKLDYFGFMIAKEFSYIIKERETLVSYKFKVKEKRDWKSIIISGLAGFLLGLYMSK